MTKVTDMVGKKIGRLRVLRQEVSKGGKARWMCACDCGNTKEIVGKSLRNGNTKSCGCLARVGTHKMSGTPEFIAWDNMKGRCYRSSHLHFHRYGGRGITVCDEWKNSFESFIEHMGFRPTKSHSVERIDNNGNYEPSNCRWADKSEQTINTRLRSDNKSGAKGVCWCKSRNKWRVTITRNGKSEHVGFFSEKDEAIKSRIKKEKIMKSSKDLTSESCHQINLMAWCEHNGILDIFSVPNGGTRNPREGVTLKREGVKAGVPDLFLARPKGNHHGLFIEMKREIKKGYSKPVVSKLQKEWIERLNNNGYLAVVCYGFSEAKEVIEKYLQSK